MSAVDVLAVMDADGRAIALLCDLTTGRVADNWREHLAAHDEARAAVAALLDRNKRLQKLADAFLDGGQP